MYFGSDGGGIGGGIDVAGLLSNDWYFALGTFQSGPESKSAAKFAQDPLHDRGRAVLRAGKTISLPWFEVAATLRVRGKGGFVDGFTHEFRRALHDVFGMGTLAQRGNRGLKGIVGSSGHIWNDINLGSSADVKALLSHYAHG